MVVGVDVVGAVEGDADGGTDGIADGTVCSASDQQMVHTVGLP